MTFFQAAYPQINVIFSGNDIDMNYQGLANFSFGALQCSFPGSIDLYDNALTVIDFGHITSVSGRIDLDFNDLTTSPA